MLTTTTAARGHLRGMGVVWSDHPPRATKRESQEERTDLLNYDRLFQLWDIDKDNSLSVLEICWGLQNQNEAVRLPLLMFARVVRHLELLVESNENPDWQLYDAEEFKQLLFSPAPGEKGDAYFVTRYANVEYLNGILPDKPRSREQATRSSAINNNRRNTPSPDMEDLSYDGRNVKTRLELVFESWDVNGDEVLSVSEIRSALRKSAGATHDQHLSEQERNDMISYIRNLEESGEELDWQELDFRDFYEIVMTSYT